MNQIERRDKGLAYVCDDEAFAQQVECRRILQKLNFMDRSDFDGIKEVVKKLFGKSDEPFVNPPFYCDYGFNIEVGKEFFVVNPPFYCDYGFNIEVGKEFFCELQLYDN